MLSTPQSSPNLAVKKSNEYKLVSYEIRFPDFYFSLVKNGWLCRIYYSSSHGIAGNRAFVDKPRILGRHPLARFPDHLNSSQQKLSVKNKQWFKEISNRNSNVWKMTFNASLLSGETKRQNNCIILKCFLKTTVLLVRKNWAHSHNFRDIVKLVADCGAKEISYHLLTAPRNAKYLSPVYVSKHLETCLIIWGNRHWKVCEVIYILFYTDETRDVTSKDQLAIYPTFLWNESISKYFMVLILVSKEVGAQLSVVNITFTLENFFV